MQKTTELTEIISKGRPDLSMDTIALWVKYLSQLQGCSLFSVISQGVDEAKWLENRKKGIGGSDIAAIAGRSPWSTAYQMWMTKTGQFDELQRPEQNESARWGNLLETVVADEWAKRSGRKYIHIPVMLSKDSDPFMLANVDGFVLSDDMSTITGILEIKTTSAFNSHVWEVGPIPEYYMCQVNWYCGVTGLSEFTIACLVGGQRLYYYDFPALTDLINELQEAGRKFWLVNVEQFIEPEITGGDMELMKDLAADADEELEPIIYEDQETENLAEAYCNVRAKKGELEKIQEIIKAQLLAKLVESNQALTLTHSLSLKKQTRRSCNWDLLEAEYPEAYKACVSYNITKAISVR